MAGERNARLEMFCLGGPAVSHNPHPVSLPSIFLQPPLITVTQGPRESLENANLLNTGFLLKTPHFQALPEQVPAYLSASFSPPLVHTPWCAASGLTLLSSQCVSFMPVPLLFLLAGTCFSPQLSADLFFTVKDPAEMSPPL